MMDHQRLQSRNLSLALVLVAAIGGFACGGTRANADSGAGVGEGGTTGLGGSSGLGGMVGAGGTLGGGSGGVATIPTITCATDAECAGNGLFCEPTTKQCAQCVKSTDCPSGGHCMANRCVSVEVCGDSLDCVNKDEVCDPSRGVCVQCARDLDCTVPGQTCVSNRCVAVVGCQASIDASTGCGAGQVCDPASSKCVECMADGDCSSGTQHCVQNTCRMACATDKTCTPQGMLCDLTNSTCVLCKSDSDCPASSFCNAGTCKADICDSTQAMCVGNSLAPCNANGSGWGPIANCPAAKPCKAGAGTASCGGSPPIDGGSTPGDGPIGTCSSGTVNPCSTMPKLTGTQTLDGKDDDFCEVPSFLFNAANAAKINNYNSVPTSQFESVTGQVAWSSAGFSAFFAVTDSSVQTVNMKDTTQAISKAYQGDSIEIMISSNNNVTGLTGTDNNTLHVIVPANGPAVSTKASNSSGTSTGTATALAAGQYKQAKTNTGYAIEVQLPWPGGAAPTAGTQIRFDLALNSADTNFGGVDDMRDGQMVYYVGTVTGTTTCQSGDGTVPYCDDRTWCVTTAQ